MPKKIIGFEHIQQKQRLTHLYTDLNLSIKEIASILHMSRSGIYGQLLRLQIPISRSKKKGYNNQRHDIIVLPFSNELAEFIGIMLGDGCLRPFQIAITLGTKEYYVYYVGHLINTLFGITPKYLLRTGDYHEVYFGSTKIVKWLIEMGLKYNKVRDQVDIPLWCFETQKYMQSTVRGLLDTDGSIYRIRSELQMSFTNKSIPLLKSTQSMLRLLGYSPSKISSYKIYLTKKADIARFMEEIKFANIKHFQRYLSFTTI